MALLSLPQAILFDNDGVLIESEPLHWRAWTQLLEELDLPAREKDLQALVGRTGPQILGSLLDRYRPGWSPREYDLDALALRKNDHYLRAIPAELRLYPGVREGLEWLNEQGIKVAIVTNAKRRELEASLDAVGTRSLFHALVSRDDVPRHKPDPLPYLTAAALCEVAPHNALVVEDSPIGLEAGLRGKIPCVGILHNFDEDSLRAPIPDQPDLRPHLLLPTTRDLFAHLERLVP